MIKMRQIRGYSLLELLIALSLGVFIVGTTLHFFETTRRTQRVQNELNAVRENAKFAIDMIKEDVQMAGFYGCATRWDESTLINTLNTPQDDFRWNFSQGLYGSEFSYDSNSTPKKTWQPTLDNTLSATTWGDTITIRHAARREFNVVEHTSATAKIKTTANNGIKQYDYLLVTDCEQSSIFQKTNATTGSQNIQHTTTALDADYAGNATSDLGKQYPNTAKLMKLNSVTYYLADSPEGVRTLYKRNSTRNAEQVVSGITDLQIQYGVDEDGDLSTDNYYTADQVQNNNWWDNVLVVTVTVRAAGFNDNGAAIMRADGTAMEYELTAAINIRNRLP